MVSDLEKIVRTRPRLCFLGFMPVPSGSGSSFRIFGSGKSCTHSPSIIHLLGGDVISHPNKISQSTNHPFSLQQRVLWPDWWTRAREDSQPPTIPKIGENEHVKNHQRVMYAYLLKMLCHYPSLHQALKHRTKQIVQLFPHRS